MKEKNRLSAFVKQKRKIAKLSQVELAEKAEIGLKTLRDLEQGKTSLRMDSVNKILRLFGAELGPMDIQRD